MNAQNKLEVIQNLWDELGITDLLEEHVPLPRRYLVDRLLKFLNGSETTEDDQCMLLSNNLP
jgi:hypothetical protein